MPDRNARERCFRSGSVRRIPRDLPLTGVNRLVTMLRGKKWSQCSRSVTVLRGILEQCNRTGTNSAIAKQDWYKLKTPTIEMCTCLVSNGWP